MCDIKLKQNWNYNEQTLTFEFCIVKEKIFTIKNYVYYPLGSYLIFNFMYLEYRFYVWWLDNIWCYKRSEELCNSHSYSFGSQLVFSVQNILPQNSSKHIERGNQNHHSDQQSFFKTADHNVKCTYVWYINFSAFHYW